MSQLPCSLCRDHIDCKGRELTKLKKHIKSEHDIVKYKVDLVLALSCISLDEEGRLIKEVQKRMERFMDTGEMVIVGSIFEEVKETIPLKESDITCINKDIEAIQKRIVDVISED